MSAKTKTSSARTRTALQQRVLPGRLARIIIPPETEDKLRAILLVASLRPVKCDGGGVLKGSPGGVETGNRLEGDALRESIVTLVEVAIEGMQGIGE